MSKAGARVDLSKSDRKRYTQGEIPIEYLANLTELLGDRRLYSAMSTIRCRRRKKTALLRLVEVAAGLFIFWIKC